MITRTLTLVGLIALTACQRPSPEVEPAPLSDGAPEAAVNEAGAGAEAEAEAGSGAETSQGEENDAPDARRPDEAETDTSEELAPPTLPSLMRQAGYEHASEAALSDFVHVPPGAEGEAGTFGEGANAVRVALIAYPNPRYVRPHVTDVLERARVLEEARETVLSHHRWVVHIVAVDRERADDAAARLARVLGW